MPRPGYGVLADRGRRARAGLGLVCAAVAATLVMLGTRYPGPGLYGDGAGYLGAAESLVHTGRLRVPFAPYNSADSTAALAQWPPLFPVVLSVPVAAGRPPVQGARLVQAVAGACTVAVSVVVMAEAAGLLWGGVLALVLLVTPALVAVHLNVISEPTYIVCLSLMVAAMARRGTRPLAYGSVAAVSELVRYVGVASVAAAGVWALTRPGSARTRLLRAAVAVAPGAVVREAWLAYVRWTAGDIRPLHIDPAPIASAGALLRATAGWLAPLGGGAAGGRAALKAALGGAILVGLLAQGRARRWRWRPVSGASREAGISTLSGSTAGRLAAASLLLAVCQLAVLLVARWLYADVAFYDRMLAPVQYLFDLAAVAWLAARWPAMARAGRAVAVVAAGMWVVASAAAAVTLARVATTEGLDHGALTERRSPTIAWVRAHAAQVPIYTNEPAKIYFHLHRDSRTLPWILDPDTARALDAVLRLRPGAVVWFAAGTAANFVSPDLLPRASSPTKLEATLPLRTVARFDDGIVWLRAGPAQRSDSAADR